MPIIAKLNLTADGRRQDADICPADMAGEISLCVY